MDLRFCEEGDFASILSIDAASPYPWPPDVLHYELFSKESSSCLGAFSLYDGRLLGYGVLGLDKKSSFILKLIVSEEHRRKGVGSQILIALSEASQAYGFDRISLRVRVDNVPAHSLYVMFGFAEDEIIPNYYHDGASALLMSASLPLYLPGDDVHYEGGVNE